MNEFILFVGIGFISGCISSMGFGGGSILILLLTAFFNVPQIKAQGINLYFFIPVAAVSLFFHFKNGSIDKKIACNAILFGITGAAGGAFLAIFFQDTIPLKKIFAVMVLLLGLRELFRPGNKKSRG